MKKIIALALALVMAISMCTVSFAGSRTGGGSAIVVKSAKTDVYTSNPQTGDWAISDGKWTCSINGKQLRSTWALIYVPSTGASQWYYFNEDGYMLTGWVWIKGADGYARCYYLNPSNGSRQGACYLDGKTPDGFNVDSTGAWVVNGVQQLR